jgi:hypothetical protein
MEAQIILPPGIEDGYFYPGQKGAGYGYAYGQSPTSGWYAESLVQWTFEIDTNVTFDEPIVYPPAGAFPLEFTLDDFNPTGNGVVFFSLYYKNGSFENCTVNITDQTNTVIGNTILSKDQHNPNFFPPGALTWKVASKPADGDEWTVLIKGIRGAEHSNIKYTIKFFDSSISRSPMNQTILVK